MLFIFSKYFENNFYYIIIYFKKKEKKNKNILLIMIKGFLIQKLYLIFSNYN